MRKSKEIFEESWKVFSPIWLQDLSKDVQSLIVIVVINEFILNFYDTLLRFNFKVKKSQEIKNKM